MERENELPPTEPGTSQVHSEINLHPSKGRGMSGKLTEGGGKLEHARERVEEARDSVNERAEALRNRVHEAQDDVRERASGIRDRTRERISEAGTDARRLKDEARSRVNDTLEETGARDRIDRFPLVALGVAFGTGFLLAGSSASSRGRSAKVRQQIRGAVMTAATAAIARQARGMLGLESGHGGGLGQMIDSIMGGRADKQSASRRETRPAGRPT